MQLPGQSGETEPAPVRILAVGDVPTDVTERLGGIEPGRDVAVDSVATAHEALDSLERTGVSCVVSTSSLPSVDVLTLLDGVRALSPNVPVVVVSETHDDDVARKVLAYDATDYVHWQGERYQLQQVVERVENAVALSRARRTANWTTAYFDALVQQAPDGMLVIDASNRIVFANRGLERILGHPPGELVGEPLTTLVPERLREAHLEAFYRYQRTETRTLDWDYVELPGLHAEGHEVPLALSFREVTHEGRRLFSAIVRDVTGRKQREEQLEASREKYQRLVETAPDAILVVDAETGEIIDTNDAAERLLGKSRDEIVGMHQWELHPPSEAERYRRIFEDHVESGGIHQDDDDYYVVHDDGHEIPVEISSGVTEIGDRTLNQAIFRDITARKRREERLATLREVTRDLMTAETKAEICDVAVSTVRDILDSPICGVHLFDENEGVLRPVATTTDAEQLFDGVPSFEVGEGLAWRVFTEGTPRLYEGVSEREEVYNPETPIQTEMILPLGEHGVLTAGSTTNDELTTAELDLAKILAANTEAALDRADREQTIERQRDQLQAELDEVFERIDDGFFALDEEWRFTYSNEQTERLLDTTQSDLLGDVVWDALPELGESGAREAFERAIATQDPVVHEERVESLDAWFEFHAYPSESGLSVYFRDVTSRKHREEQLEQQNERLESFASMLAHELRNPLSIAQIYLDSAGDGDETAFEQVATSLDRMEEMIDVLLVMTRGGDATIEPEPVSLRETATEVWENVAADDARLEVETDLVVAAEPHHVRHLLENLFKNSVEHGRGEVTVRLGSLESDSEDGTREADRTNGGFYLADDGPGVPESDRKRVFEAGYTTDDGGIGLGLTFISQLAETYGWECRLTESEAGGARFEFRDVTIVQ